MIVIIKFQIKMNVTIKHKASQQAALLSRISTIKFMPKQSISKQIKDSIDYEHLHSVSRYTNRRKGGYLCYKNETIYQNFNPQSLKAPIQPQQKIMINKINFINTIKDPSHLIRRDIINRQVDHHNDTQHKMSIQTAVSTTLSANNSAQKRRAFSHEHQLSDDQMIMRQQLSQLKQKNSAYMIRWRNSASNITKSMRVILGEWLMQFAKEIEVPKNVFYNAMHYLDKYAGTVHIPRKKYQQVGLCAIFIASKLEISSHPTIDTYIEALDGSCTKQQIIQLEQIMVFKLKFRLNPPTLHQYMVLVVSLFENFAKRKSYQQLKNITLGAKSEFQKDLFWVLDGIHLEDSYKTFHNKEKICLTVLYLCLKKQKIKKFPTSKKKVLAELESLNLYGNLEQIFQEFLAEVIRIFNKLNELKQCIKFFKKWVKYDRNTISDDQQGQMLKKIILNQS